MEIIPSSIVSIWFIHAAAQHITGTVMCSAYRVLRPLWCKGHQPRGAGVILEKEAVCVCVCVWREVRVASAIMKYEFVFSLSSEGSKVNKRFRRNVSKPFGKVSIYASAHTHTHTHPHTHFWLQVTHGAPPCMTTIMLLEQTTDCATSPQKKPPPNLFIFALMTHLLHASLSVRHRPQSSLCSLSGLLGTENVASLGVTVSLWYQIFKSAAFLLLSLKHVSFSPHGRV